jgi:hypothetical protein
MPPLEALIAEASGGLERPTSGETLALAKPRSRGN